MRIAPRGLCQLIMKLLSYAGLAALLTAEAWAHSEYSTWMLKSIISRQQGVVSSGAASSTLESGILALALEAWLDHYPHHDSAADIGDYLDLVLTSVDPTFKNASQTALLPLDRLSVGQALTHLDRSLTTSETFALSTLNSSLAIQQRNEYGGLWYYVYPQWSYLDGAVSFLPFMALDPSWSRVDMKHQIDLLYSHCYDNSTGLVFHGYDASKTAVWANPTTGASPYVWGRSLGWYLAGLVNTWEVLTTSGKCSGAATASLLSTIKTQLRGITAALVTYADPATGAWWQLPTFPGREGNYLESSSTALFMFSLLKGVRLGAIDDLGFTAAALKAYKYTKETFVVDSGNGTLGYNGTVSVCSLNSTATYDYYVTRALVPNSLLGEAAFVLASLEVERLK